jgi:hypothetical protein
VATDAYQSLSRRAENVSIYCGPDVTDLLGAGTSGLSAAAQTLLQNILTQNLTPVAQSDSLVADFSRTNTQRFAFGPNSMQPFQVVPGVQKCNGLQLSHFVYNRRDEPDRLFAFRGRLPLEQIYPWVIQCQEVGPPLANGEPDQASQAQFLFFGCWIAASKWTWSNTVNDQRLIQSLSLTAGTCVDYYGDGNDALDGVLGALGTGLAGLPQVSQVLSGLSLS